MIDLASTVDERLAAILRDGPPPESPRLPWSGGRRQGLELCLTMLRYAREEVEAGELSQRLDDAIAYAAVEVARALKPDQPVH